MAPSGSCSYLDFPSLQIRLRSWCDQWVSVSGNSRFSNKEQQDSANLSQLMISCQPASESSCLLNLKCRTDGRYDLQIGEEKCTREGRGCFLAFSGRRIGLRRNSGLDTAFSIQFAEEDKLCFRGGSENLYLSVDQEGQIYTGPTKPRKWEWFTMVRQCEAALQKSSMPLPIRVTLRGHNGRYLCTCHPTVTCQAEVTCCCEELLLDVGSIPCTEADSEAAESLTTTIRTASGKRLLSANSSGGLSTVDWGSARGSESFLIHMTGSKWPRVAMCYEEVLDENSNGHSYSAQEKKYIGVDSKGRVCSDRERPDTWEQFTLELVSGSKLLIQGVNGRFLAGEPQVTCRRSEPFDCWHLRSHGDGLFSFVAAPSILGRGESYLYVDEFGLLQQSSEPSMQFPATCSLFLLEPVALKAEKEREKSPAKALLAHISRRERSDGCERPEDQRIVGFSMKSARKINGRERYLSVEPNGTMRASRLSVARTEVFAFSDVDALAERVSPSPFRCEAAAHSSRSFRQTLPRATSAEARAHAGAADEAAAQEAKEASSRLRKQIQAAGHAIAQRALNPKPLRAKLQALCVDVITSEAAKRLPFPPSCTSDICRSPWGVDLPLEKPPRSRNVSVAVASVTEKRESVLQALLNAAAPPCTYDGAFSDERRLSGPLAVIPNDVLDQIDLAWLDRQPRQHSCKWPVRVRRRARARFEDPGFLCTRCEKEGLSRLDPLTNPAHHRYLDAQRRLNGVGPLRNRVWNPLTVTAVSMVSGLLMFGRGGRRSHSSGHSGR